ncbi:hypothetical protein [Haloferula sp. BvORR071]|uniref:hypothetical protein n=1 Tax=Haloferula sp. BvORR071 TaxID=1396141 RepID=UPI000554BAD7|nr:hypothetical protein [Haloferula sp. BvORR071]
MANVFAILSAIALAAACFLAMKNKDAYEAEIKHRITAEEKQATAKSKLEDVTNKYKATNEERINVEKETADLKQNLLAENAKNDKLTSEKDAKASEEGANAKKITEIEEQLKEIGPIEDLVATINTLKGSLEELTTDIAASDAKIADLTADKARTEGVIKAYSDKNQNYANKRSFFAGTRISAIYPAYGFVTLPIGNSSGVVSGSSLDVVRDGAVVAKLRVSSVEAGRAAAEIVPDSLAQDTTLMVGDRVVPGSAATASPAPAR